MLSLDTNVLLRFLLGDVPEQSHKAKDLITSNKVYVTDVVVSEAVYVLERVIRHNRQDIVRLFKDLLMVNTLTSNDYFLEEAIELYGDQSSLSFVDCYSAAEAAAYGNGLATFDKKLIKYGGQHVTDPQ